MSPLSTGTNKTFELEFYIYTLSFNIHITYMHIKKLLLGDSEGQQPHNFTIYISYISLQC